MSGAESRPHHLHLLQSGKPASKKKNSCVPPIAAKIVSISVFKILSDVA